MKSTFTVCYIPSPGVTTVSVEVTDEELWIALRRVLERKGVDVGSHNHGSIHIAENGWEYDNTLAVPGIRTSVG